MISKCYYQVGKKAYEAWKSAEKFLSVSSSASLAVASISIAIGAANLDVSISIALIIIFLASICAISIVKGKMLNKYEKWRNKLSKIIKDAPELKISFDRAIADGYVSCEEHKECLELAKSKVPYT